MTHKSYIKQKFSASRTSFEIIKQNGLGIPELLGYGFVSFQRQMMF
jgi:hypothetical protein